MSLFNTFKEKVRSNRIRAKHIMTGAAFALALACSVTLGLHVHNATASASTVRDCKLIGGKPNSIDYAQYPHAGDCGAADPSELIADIKHGDPSDLPTIYTYFGLSPSVYTQFINTAKQGVVTRDGNVVVDNQTVMTDVQSYGRVNFGTGRTAQKVGSTTLYHGTPANSFAAGVKSLDAMVMFDGKGVVEAVVMNSCGNGVTGKKVTPSVTCHALTSVPSTSNPNTYTFGAQANFGPNTSFSRAVYHFSDGSKDVTTTKLNDTFSRTLTKDTTVTVTIYAKVPGGNEIKAVAVADCARTIKYIPPVALCTNLQATAIDNNTFRFTIKTQQDVHTTVKNADFILDNTVTTSGVTTKDASGNIFKEYSFTDSVSHTVKVTVFFNTLAGVKSDAGHCKAIVTPKQPPMCTIPGRTNLPPDSPQCAYCLPGVPVGSAECTPPKCTVPGHTDELPTSSTCGYCQPGIPIGSAACTPTPPPTPPTTPPKVLTNTGPGQTIGLFFGVTIAGFFAHKMFLSRRARRELQTIEIQTATAA